MQRGRAPRRELNNRVVFERLWRGTFQAVLAGTHRRPRASSHDPNPDTPTLPSPMIMPQQGPANIVDLEPALRTIIEGLRNSCCCRCNCSTDRYNDNLQVCLSNDEERKSMRSVIRCAQFYLYWGWSQVCISIPSPQFDIGGHSSPMAAHSVFINSGFQSR